MAGSAVIGTLRAILTLDTAEFETNSAKISQSAKGWTTDLKRMGSQASAIGGALTKTLTLPILGIGYAAVEAGATFEQTMNQVSAVTNSSEADMKKLAAAALEWGQKTKFSNTEAAEAMLELGKAGFDADKTIAALPSTLQLATAANMGLAEAAQMTSNVMNTFGLKSTELAHANDILAAAANSSTIDVADLRESLKFVGPVAHIAGVSLADVAAASALLGNNGVKAEMAGTGLRNMFANLLAPAKPLQKMLYDLGYGMEVEAGKTVEWSQMLDRLHAKFAEGKESADSYAGKIMLAFGKRAGPAVIAMAQEGGAAIKELSATLDASAGTAEKMTDAYMKGTAGAIENMKGSFETAASTLLTAIEPVLIPVLNGLKDFADFISGTLIPAFTALPQPIQTFAVVLAGIAAAAGPVLVVLGTVLSGAGAVAAAFTTTGIATTTLSAALPILVGAFEILTGPIGWAIGAAGLLATAWMTWGDDIKRIASETYATIKDYLWDKLEPVLTPLIELIDSVGKMFEAFGALVAVVVEKVYKDSQMWLEDKLGGAFKFVKDVVKDVVDFVGTWLAKIPDSLLPLLGPIGAVVLAFRHWDEITAIAKAVYTGVKTWLIDKFTEIVGGVKEKIDAVTGFFKDMYDKVVGHSYVPDMVDRVRDQFGRFDTVMVNPTKIATDLVNGMFSDMFSKVTSGGEQWQKDMGSIVSGTMKLVEGNLEKGKSAWEGYSKFAVSSIYAIEIELAYLAAKTLYYAYKDQGWKGYSETPLPPADTGVTPPQSGYDDNGNIDPNGPYGDQLRGSMTDAEWNNYLANHGVPGYKTGTMGQYVDFGAGTLAMLHGPEMITPKGEGLSASSASGGGFTVILEQDGRKSAQWFAPYLVDEVMRLRLA